MLFADYKAVAKRLTDEHPDPGQTIRDWARLWGEIFTTMLKGRDDGNGGAIGQAIFEPCALAVARWELLGTLLTGWPNDSNRTQSLQYARRFLDPVNARYGVCHPTIHPQKTIAELLVIMLRNGSLHSFTPRGVYETTRNSCIGCGLDYRLDPAGTGHLEFTSNDSLYVDGTKFVQELVDSMGVYADYLDRNVPDQPGGPTPQDNFREGWFSRFRPRGPNGENPAVWTY